mmetsp:Transcript_89336/g.251515  ORF Transcript_89336/g.251515 Transcript_89336/m.251515 type:complete len:286 (-) Transcript_89336:121-978(-)|eukprot:CAMPEP_0117522484 /NCGR_PEP_ID=MMETSP0784-20121206/34232_1 /TAXON_ID=39447 /ORGANISM="" /LENGTH=285 /DNA_ID=CAMNT_0005318559 /DNA_START=23 /DNA_END=880 /DNA_ORIENTATION=-
MAALGTFSPRTLNDNWFEDRTQPSGALSATGGLSLKHPRPYETDITAVGARYDVLSRISRMPPRESYAFPDDGFREKDATTAVDFVDPRTRKEFITTRIATPRMIVHESVPEICCEERRPIPGNLRGFGAVLNRHEENHDRRFFNTTMEDFHGEGDRLPPMRIVPDERHPAAGLSTTMEQSRVQGVKLSELTGEKHTRSLNPACDTKTQRAWLYHDDPSLQNVHLGGIRRTPRKFDNELSLPMPDCTMAKVRADLEERKGRLYRVATNITKGPESRPGVSIFQDD